MPRGIGDVHAAIADRVFGLLGPPARPVRLVHDTLSRGVYETVAGGVWLAAAALAATLSEPLGALAIAALNGLYGDRLEAEGSPLAIPMAVRRIGATITPHLVVFLHGLGETEHAWGSPNYGDLLDDATPVFIRFNTGRHISDNGAALARLLDELVRDWPVEVERITLIGHSMGGLVARSACHRGGAWTRQRPPRDLARHAARRRAARAGRARAQRRAAPRARDAPVRPLPAPPQRRHPRPAPRLAGGRGLARPGPRRAARQGASRGPAARGRHALLRLGHDHPQRAHPVGRLLGDMLVLPPSAAGRRIGLAAEHGLTLGGTHHLALLNHPAVAEQLREWLSAG